MVLGVQTRVKICGITNLQDALWAAECGADALGFIFYPKSKRFVPWKVAGEIIKALPPFIARVGVFVDAEVDTIRQAIQESGITQVQLHGDEPPGFGEELGVPMIKAFRVADESSLARCAEYRVSALLLDTYSADMHGGTGEVFNWQLARKAMQLGRLVILAGGLTPENVTEAVALVRPYGVDVSSGVESSPGEKDPAKVARFIARVRA